MFLKDCIVKHSNKSKDYTLEIIPVRKEDKFFKDLIPGQWFHYYLRAVYKSELDGRSVYEISFIKIQPLEVNGIVYNAMDFSDGSLYHLDDDTPGDDYDFVLEGQAVNLPTIYF